MYSLIVNIPKINVMCNNGKNIIKIHKPITNLE